ncbi:Thioredoxin [Micrococcales bacterium KH10]|nr:Thioredoxin [Micrococcales bacterium KH10]
MSPVIALVIVAALVAVTTILGFVLRSRSVRVTKSDITALDLRELGIPTTDGLWSVVQFTTVYCSRCPAVRRSITSALQQRPDAVFSEVDLTDRPQVANQLRILQTPTVLVVAPDGMVAARLAGEVTGADVVAEIE